MSRLPRASVKCDLTGWPRKPSGLARLLPEPRDRPKFGRVLSSWQGLPAEAGWYIVRGVSHSVLFREFPLDQFEAIGEVVGRIYGIPSYDALTKIRRGWGFLERDVSAGEAQRLSDALAEQGVATIALPNAELLDPPEPEVMVGLEIEADGFVPQLQSPKAQPHHIAWSDVAILAAGGFTEEMVRRETASSGRDGKTQLIGLGVFLVTGIPMGLFGGKKKETKPVKVNRLITFAQIITAQGESFHFDPEHFDFTGLGPQKQVNASLNFRALISEFARLTPARINVGVRHVLANQSLTQANYQSLKDFETELLWLVNTSAAK